MGNKIIPAALFCNQKGGVGKTAAADEFAFSLERTGTPFSFFDLDGQGGVLHNNKNPDSELCVVDTPGTIHKNMRKWVQNSGVVIIPTRPTLTDIPAFKRTQNIVRAIDPEKPIIFLLNCVNRYSACREFEDWFFNQEIFKNKSIKEISLQTAIIPQSEKIVQAHNRKMSVVEYAPRDWAADRTLFFVNMIRRVLGLPLEEKLIQSSKNKNRILKKTE